MDLTGIPANYILAVFIGVSLMKAPFDWMKNKNLSNWLVRLFAIVLGIGIVWAQYEGGADHPAGVTTYAMLVVGLKAGVGAILVYHIGTTGFSGFFSDNNTTTITTTQDVPATVKTETKIVDIAPQSVQTKTQVPAVVTNDVQHQDTVIGQALTPPIVEGAS